jgi:hypothetical protein
LPSAATPPCAGMNRLPYRDAEHGLRALLGDASRDPALLTALVSIDQSLRQFAAGLQHAGRGPWRTSGLTLDELAGPPRKYALAGYVENLEVTFWVQLARGDFYANHEQLDRSPEHYYVEAEVYVVSDRRFSAGQDTALELPVHDTVTPAAAVAALAEGLTALRGEATRRPPTERAWRVRQ